MSSVNTNSNFRYDINALRAIAVLGVVMFHYKVPGFGGGFCGVDIFFVISGYLMSRIIINGIGKGNFSVLDFYIRRAKRIIPALLVLVAVMSCVAFFLYFPEDYKTNEGNAASSLVFLSNIYYMLHSGYFDADAESNIFLHTWSLSVEWQFYLIYPLILLLIISKAGVKKLNKYYFIAITLLIGIASIVYTKHYATKSFYLLPSRSWEMLFGGAAFLSEEWLAKLKFKNTLAIIGYFVLALCLGFIPVTSHWPGKLTIIPVFATYLVIAANYNNFKLCKTLFLQYIGKISYSIYLWHWPLYVFAAYLGFKQNFVFVTALTALSLISGYLSFKYIESRQVINGKFLWVSVIALFAVACTLAGFETNSFLFKKGTLIVASYKQKHVKDRAIQFNSGSCFIEMTDKFDSFDKQSCLKIDPLKKNIILIGDSHAAQFSQTFRELFAKRNVNLIQITASGTFPVINPSNPKGCPELMQFAFKQFIPQHAHSIDGIILSANWLTISSGRSKQVVKELNETLAYLKDLNVKTLLLGQHEVYTIPYPSIAAREYEYGKSIADRYIDQDSYNLNAQLKDQLGPNYVQIYALNKVNKLSPSYEPYMFDKDHFTKYGADLVSKKLFETPQFLAFFK